MEVKKRGSIRSTMATQVARPNRKDPKNKIQISGPWSQSGRTPLVDINQGCLIDANHL